MRWHEKISERFLNLYLKKKKDFTSNKSFFFLTNRFDPGFQWCCAYLRNANENMWVRSKKKLNFIVVFYFSTSVCSKLAYRTSVCTLVWACCNTIRDKISLDWIISVPLVPEEKITCSFLSLRCDTRTLDDRLGG